MQLVRFRIDLAPGCSLGPGKIDLLEAIAPYPIDQEVTTTGAEIPR